MEEIPICHMGKGEKMKSIEILYKQGELMKEDQRIILIIRGIEIFLPHSPIEARACVVEATTEGQPMKNVIEEEVKEQILKSSPSEEEEHIVEFLTPWEQELRLLEEWICHPGTKEDFQNAFMHIEVEPQYKEHLEEVGYIPTEEMTEVNLSGEIVEKHLNDETIELDSTTEWLASATRGEGRKGDEGSKGGAN